MKVMLRFTLIYFIVLLILWNFYSNISEKYENDLAATKKKSHGVEYLVQFYNLSKDYALYHGALQAGQNTTLSKSLKTNILETINEIQEQHKNNIYFHTHLQKTLLKMKQFTFSEKEFYEFLDLINLENYKIGDSSLLLFEANRKLYFLNSLATHYMSEYTISILITNNLLKEFHKNGKLSNEKLTNYIEQNKLVSLSSQEVSGIINFLTEYEDTQNLRKLIDETLSVIKKISHLKDPILEDSRDIEEYIKASDTALELSYTLNNEMMSLLRERYQTKIKNLQKKILINQLSFGILIILFTLLTLYFINIFIANKKKADEITKLNEELDNLVIFSKTDSNGLITHVSSALLNLSGYTNDELIGKTHSLFKHEDMDVKVYDALWETILNKETWVGELLNKRKDGSTYWAKLTIVPDLDKDDEITGFIAYREIITYQKELEAQKQKTQAALDFKSKFLSNMSHEIRTPLNGIIGLNHVLKKTSLDENQQSIIKKIDYSSDLLLGIVNDILDISKIESGKLLIEEIPFDIKVLAKNIFDLFEDKVKAKHLDFKIEYLDFSNFRFLGDTLRISQIVTNLLNNAIKFTHEGSVILRITQKENNRILFEVIDTGIGLERESVKKLFEDFTQADMSTSRKYGGSGLGLSITKNLVELMNGKIWVTSTFGKGSTFSFEIPLIPSDEESDTVDDDKEATTEEHLLEEELNKLTNIHILVAEDNKMNQMVLEMLLEESQIALDFADDGVIAVEKVQERAYDLILMDIQMPHMNGFDATKAIRELGIKIPIIALSANIMQEDTQRALEYGMDAYLAKPIDVVKLYTLLLEHLKK